MMSDEENAARYGVNGFARVCTDGYLPIIEWQGQQVVAGSACKDYNQAKQIAHKAARKAAQREGLLLHPDVQEEYTPHVVDPDAKEEIPDDDKKIIGFGVVISIVIFAASLYFMYVLR